MWYCPVCNLKAFKGVFVCTYCTPEAQWVHYKCGGYSGAQVLRIPPDQRTCNNCKTHGGVREEGNTLLTTEEIEMTRRNVKRVDYQNIKPISIGSSSDDEYYNDNNDDNDGSDDDFVDELTPPPTKKKKKVNKTSKETKSNNKDKKVDNKAKQSEQSKKTTVHNGKKAESLTSKPHSPHINNSVVSLLSPNSSRASRNSNTEHCFEQDLLTAIEISQLQTDSTCDAIPIPDNDAEEDTECADGDFDDDFDAPCKQSKNKKRSTKARGGKENIPVIDDEDENDDENDEKGDADSSGSKTVLKNSMTDDEDEDDIFPTVPVKPASNKRLKENVTKETNDDPLLGIPNESTVTTKPSKTKRNSTSSMNGTALSSTTKVEKKQALTPDLSSTSGVGTKKKEVKTLSTPNMNLLSTVGMATPKSSSSSSKVVRTCGASSSSTSGTPSSGRLRLGLSRNIRVTKPLHSNVNIAT